jgi:hypothetical protein
VEIALAVGDGALAQSAAAELHEIAETFRSAALRAAAECARGAVQLADNESGAVESLRTGWQLWRDVEAPYEAARARFLLGRALHAAGDRVGGRLEVQAAQTAFERLGAVLDAEQAAQVAAELAAS